MCLDTNKMLQNSKGKRKTGKTCHVNPENRRNGGACVLVAIFVGMHSSFHRDGPGNVDAKQGDGAGHVHDTPAEATDEHGNGEAADQTPDSDAHVDVLGDFAFSVPVGQSDHLEEGMEVV